MHVCMYTICNQNTEINNIQEQSLDEFILSGLHFNSLGNLNIDPLLKEGKCNHPSSDQINIQVGQF